MRIVQVVPRDFRHAQDGGRIKTNALATALAACGELHVVDFGKHTQPGTPLQIERALPFGGSARFHCVAEAARARGVPPWLFRSAGRVRHAVGRAVIREIAADLVVADDMSYAEYVLGLPGVRRIVHTHNVESILHRELAAKSGKRRLLRRAAHYQDIERRLLPRGEAVWAVSDTDADYYRALGCRQVAVTPNIVPNSAFEPAAADGEPGLAFYFGSLWWGPNRDAAVRLAEIAARLSPLRPAYRYRVGGRGATAELEARLQQAGRHGLSVLGFVPSLKDEARRCAAIVIPIEWGGGTKIKTIEALALAKPVLTTPQGAEGLDLVDGEHALVRPLGVAFDQALVELLDHPERYREMAWRGREYVWRRFSQAALERAVAAAVGALHR